jgi:hypothetical protein
MVDRGTQARLAGRGDTALARTPHNTRRWSRSGRGRPSSNPHTRKWLHGRACERAAVVNRLPGRQSDGTIRGSLQPRRQIRHPRLARSVDAASGVIRPAEPWGSGVSETELHVRYTRCYVGPPMPGRPNNAHCLSRCPSGRARFQSLVTCENYTLDGGDSERVPVPVVQIGH